MGWSLAFTGLRLTSRPRLFGVLGGFGSVRKIAMAPSYVLAIDQGTTSTRAILFDKNGQVSATQQAEFPQYYPQAGWTEHDPEEILQGAIECTEGAMKKVGAKKEDIAGIGITNQRESTVAWDKATGKPLCRAIVWLDLRTSDTVAKLAEEQGGRGAFRKKTGLPISTYFSAVKMRWMIDNVPEVKKAMDEERCCFGTIESWLIYKLSGGADGGVHITDISNASRYMLMNIHTCEWDEAVCNQVGVSMKALPSIKSNSEVYGHVKSVPSLEGLPISGALGDQHAALLGHGCLEVGTSKNTYGTGCFMLLNTGGDAVESKNGLLTTIAYKLGPEERTTYALEGSVACAGRVVQWLRDNMGVISSSKDVETLASKVEDTGGLTLVPAFSGLFAPHWRDDARAVAVGMTLYTSREHMCRAALESTCFQAVDIMEAMQHDTGLKIKDMRVDGGMTVNNLLMQMQADFLGMEVLRSKMAEATALGAALAAGLSVGFYDKKETVRDMIQKAGGYEHFKPETTYAQRQHLQERWKDALKRAMNLAKWDPRKKPMDKPVVLKKPKFSKVNQVKPEMKGVNLQLKVVKLPEEVKSHQDWHDVVCGDDTGTVTLHLTPHQFLPCEVGGYIRVQNGRSRMKGGYIRLEVDKWGKVSQAEDTKFDVNLKNDISAVEYELK
ncbi:unnamed protein product [Effrenium voratum]|uniref:glycerol kinase n=1 Tax=Effrenium voratum TaxID=2562239 RepID=A0AA36ITQ7_9DINO|nr:unnamed protein product [Effrenium voratum]CAJ1393342.1 unnamed protein product [Effrenium voratum]CAJ1415412.1 unnamed protein product [Effrenium voratum]